MRGVLASAFDAIGGRLAVALWTRGLPLALRAGLLRAVFARKRGGGWSARGMDRICLLLAEAGAAALARDPVAVRPLLAALVARGGAPLLIAGDSHSRLHVHRDRKGARWLLPLHWLATGASARGLANPRSRSGQGIALREAVAAAQTAGLQLPLLLVFGQVDAEFVFLFKRLESDPPALHDHIVFANFCGATVEAYADYAAELASATGWSVTLAAIFPPALSDEAWREGYLNAHIADAHGALPRGDLAQRLREAEICSLVERTAQHRQFNARLAEAARVRGLGW